MGASLALGRFVRFVLGEPFVLQRGEGALGVGVLVPVSLHAREAAEVPV